MAHPCFECGSECFCSGDIDDAIVSRTPAKCKGCGMCLRQSEYDDEDFEDEEDDSWQPCDNCDLPDACADFGCAIKAVLTKGMNDVF